MALWRGIGKVGVNGARVKKDGVKGAGANVGEVVKRLQVDQNGFKLVHGNGVRFGAYLNEEILKIPEEN